MESGLDGRNNECINGRRDVLEDVSMESGLDGRNNCDELKSTLFYCYVSMESGLDGRNNALAARIDGIAGESLNGVRPRWPEQLRMRCFSRPTTWVSMESGLDGRNNNH